MATRRGFLTSLLAAGALPALSWADAGSPAYLAAAKAGEGFRLHGLTAAGASLFAVDLPARGHAACAHPRRPEAVAFARRPGTYALVIDCAPGATTARLTPPEGRQFNGHGAFLADGALLCTSEVVAEGSEGRIGLWDAADGYRRIGEWSSGGIGPHDIRSLPDGRLVVANGGIVTDPTDRTNLNIATMRPNLSLLTPDGALAEQAELEPGLRQNSMRHLAVGPDGTLAVAMQWEGDPFEIVPLMGLWRPGEAIRMCPADEAGMAAMKGYAGSISCSGDGAHLVITSPRGGAAMIFTAGGTPVETVRRADICGAAPSPAGGLVLTDGMGAVSEWAGRGLAVLARHELAWDNHLVALI